MSPFMDPGVPLPVEQLEDGRFRCKTCGACWYPMLDGRLEPTLASYRCPRCSAKGRVT